MHEKIFEIAAYALYASEAEKTILDTLISAAEAELTARLREGITPEDCGNLYIVAASLLAEAEILLLRSIDETEQFTAGEVSVRQSREKAATAAAALRRQANGLMAPFLNDDSFAFMGVQG